MIKKKLMTLLLIAGAILQSAFGQWEDQRMQPVQSALYENFQVVYGKNYFGRRSGTRPEYIVEVSGGWNPYGATNGEIPYDAKTFTGTPTDVNAQWYAEMIDGDAGGHNWRVWDDALNSASGNLELIDDPESVLMDTTDALDAIADGDLIGIYKVPTLKTIFGPANEANAYFLKSTIEFPDSYCDLVEMYDSQRNLSKYYISASNQWRKVGSYSSGPMENAVGWYRFGFSFEVQDESDPKTIELRNMWLKAYDTKVRVPFDERSYLLDYQVWWFNTVASVETDIADPQTFNLDDIVDYCSLAEDITDPTDYSVLGIPDMEADNATHPFSLAAWKEWSTSFPPDAIHLVDHAESPPQDVVAGRGGTKTTHRNISNATIPVKAGGVVWMMNPGEIDLSLFSFTADFVHYFKEEYFYTKRRQR